MLKIPFIKQENDWTCGPAVLAMLLFYFKEKNIDQIKLFERYKEKDPSGAEDFRIKTVDLVQELREEGMSVGISKAILDQENVRTLLDFYINKAKMPIVVCQQLSKEKSLLGHFKVVVGFSNDKVYVNDPHQRKGGEKIEIPLKEFISLWEETGPNVTGGIYFWCDK
tara:strand:- start:4797 stop:5297 length:501 start_codon:yes stop_codon:yes gene_type:complete